VQVIQAVLRGTVPAPSTVQPDVAPQLEAICRRALAQDPGDRYESAATMRADLDVAIDELRLRVDHRHVGERLSGQFKELRTTIKSAIEAQLRDEKALPVSLVVSDDNVVIAEQPLTTGDLWGMQGGLSVSLSRTARTKRMRKRIIAAALVLTGASALGAGLMILHRSRESARVAAVASPPPANAIGSSPLTVPAALPPEETPSSIGVNIEATPAQATLTLDGEPLSGNPFHGVRPRDTAAHELRVDAPGYHARTVKVALNAPLETRVVLEPIAAVAAAAPPRPHPVAVPAGPFPVEPKPAASTSAVASRACNPPFYFDETGVKRFKPECLR
jgi:hypothetical protein